MIPIDYERIRSQIPIGTFKWCDLRGIQHYRSETVFILNRDPEAFRYLMFLSEVYREDFALDYWYPSKEKFDMVAFNKWVFVKRKILKEEREQFAEYQKSMKGSVNSIITMLCGESLKLSISWVDDRNSYVATVTPKKGVKRNEGMSLTGWSDSWEEAVFMCGFKHEALCDGGDWSTFEVEGDWG